MAPAFGALEAPFVATDVAARALGDVIPALVSSIEGVPAVANADG